MHGLSPQMKSEEDELAGTKGEIRKERGETGGKVLLTGNLGTFRGGPAKVRVGTALVSRRSRRFKKRGEKKKRTHMKEIVPTTIEEEKCTAPVWGTNQSTRKGTRALKGVYQEKKKKPKAEERVAGERSA